MIYDENNFVTDIDFLEKYRNFESFLVTLFSNKT
jgi:hypothetical protein